MKLREGQIKALRKIALYEDGCPAKEVHPTRRAFFLKAKLINKPSKDGKLKISPLGRKALKKADETA